MKRNPVETILGAVVLVVAAFFLFFAYGTADVKKIKGYELAASFAKIGGLPTGADVRINGIKVGTVVGQKLDPATFNAVLTLSIAADIKLPSDSQASIGSDGLLGDKYVKIEPGVEKTTLEAGTQLAKTKDQKALEELVGEIIFLATEDPAKPPRDSSQE
ncbi:MAG: outer membrane lipid asymmetry maintenance protein MlaD [Alphaproteobacteria bacterium]|nr:outer membrane lipid asymmetry maintenance protein MlaD [Alphaproteobacteria bacterium]